MTKYPSKGREHIISGTVAYYCNALVHPLSGSSNIPLITCSSEDSFEKRARGRVKYWDLRGTLYESESAAE